MSIPERSARTSTRSLRTVALGGAALLSLGLAGCAHYEVLESYQPAAGVNAQNDNVDVKGLMVLQSGDGATLQGALLSNKADTLTSVTGNALTSDGSQGKSLQASVASTKLPAQTLVNLANVKSSVSGVTPGGMTSLTLNFAKSGPITVTVPVVDGKSMDVSTEAPSAAASNAG